MPVDSGLAFVVVQHLSPDFKSHMEELLARHTSIPICRIVHGIPVEANHIYLSPAKVEVQLSQGKLLLSEQTGGRSVNHPIDSFFSSLAADLGDRAVGVILSGTGSDGSRGIRDIHEAGGLVLVQDETTAKFDGMPVSARQTGAVDLILPPTVIAEAVARFHQEGLSPEQLVNEEWTFGSMEDEARVLNLLNRHSSLDFSQYKSSTVGRRLSRRVRMAGLSTLGEYIHRLSQDDAELGELYKDLLIGVTQFFRDEEAFEALRTTAVPRMLTRVSGKEPLRVWVAACATGEEAYSVAMLLDEEISRREMGIDFKVFATDAHRGSLNAAAKGLYAAAAVQNISPERLQRYFVRTSDGYQISRTLRNNVVFAAHNVLHDAPFTQMDLVTCRNMLIYLRPPAQKKALSLFHFSLKTEGILFLGPSETPSAIGDEFDALEKRWRIYSKRRDVRLPVAGSVTAGRPQSRMPYASVVVPPVKSSRVDSEMLKIYDQLLARKMGCSILVGETGEILHVFGGAERYMRSRGGRPSNHLLELIHESLRPAIANAWHHALNKREAVQYSSCTFSGGEQPQMTRIAVEPLVLDGHERAGILVEFSPADDDGSRSSDGSAAEDGQQAHQRARLESLEDELRFSQENLQATIEELETSNEELQAANEELIASNEELQSTNEELHSVNEELYTVNAEHQRRVEELAQANDDMDNLLATTRVGVIFLDDGLYIRRFTPEIARVFRLGAQDAGRSMEHFAHVLNYPDLIDDLREVLDTQAERELTVHDRAGTPYLLRMLPYQSGEAVHGVVVTLIDITTLSQAQAEIRLQQLAIDSAINGIIITDPRLPDNPITYANQGFLTLTGYTRDEVMGQNCRFLQGEETDPAAVQDIRDALRQGKSSRTVLLNYRKDGTQFWNDLQVTPLHDATGRLTHFVGIQHDITNQITAQQALQEANEASQRANEAKSSFLATMSHELRTPLTAILGFADMLIAESDDPDQLEKIGTIKRNGTYLLALLNDILDLSKVEAGKLNFDRHRVDIRRLISELETLMSTRASDAKVPLRFKYATQLPAEITADEVRVRQILVNLISNALKFTETGEVVVSTVVNHEHHPPQLEIAVTDTGIGISKRQMKKLFQPFNQASKQTTRRFGGTGLGLSISKRLAEGMGGTILAESRLHHGSRFTFVLPLSLEDVQITSEAGGTSDQDEELQHAQHGYPRIDSRVLLADDRRDVWRIGKYFLEKCGARVYIAENGQQAVEAVRQAAEHDDPFELILMDMQMPVLSGREAVALIRNEGFQTPIIALTADAMDGEREACLEMGCNEYFPKPIDGPRLMALAARMIHSGNHHPTTPPADPKNSGNDGSPAK